MFRRKLSSAARGLLRDPVFPTGAPGVPVVHLDYDPAVWTRMPRAGEDRGQWCEDHARAYAADLGLAPGSPQVAAAQAALEAAADRLLTHTVDLLALPLRSRAGKTAVAYLDLLDTDLALLEHGDPEPYLAFSDLLPARPVAAEWFPSKRDPAAFQYSTLSDPGADAPRRLFRAYRRLGADLHLYGLTLYDGADQLGDALRLVRHLQVPAAT